MTFLKVHDEDRLRDSQVCLLATRKALVREETPNLLKLSIEKRFSVVITRKKQCLKRTMNYTVMAWTWMEWRWSENSVVEMRFFHVCRTRTQLIVSLHVYVESVVTLRGKAARAYIHPILL